MCGTDLAFCFLATGSGKIDTEIWKDKDPCYSVAKHLLKPLPYKNLESRQREDKVYHSRMENRMLLEYVDYYWLHLVGFSEKETSLSKNRLVCKQKWKSIQNRTGEPSNIVKTNCF